MLKQYDRARLVRDLPVDHNWVDGAAMTLPKGTTGTVLDVHGYFEPAGGLVEFTDESGKTIAMVDVTRDDIEIVKLS